LQKDVVLVLVFVKRIPLVLVLVSVTKISLTIIKFRLPLRFQAGTKKNPSQKGNPNVSQGSVATMRHV